MPKIHQRRPETRQLRHYVEGSLFNKMRSKLTSKFYVETYLMNAHICELMLGRRPNIRSGKSKRDLNQRFDKESINGLMRISQNSFHIEISLLSYRDSNYNIATVKNLKCRV